MPLETYISDLLYRYDCVIIPEFGAFLTKRISAQIDTENNLFLPPSKVLSFNSQLQHNDGLLCNYVAELEKIPYEQALGLISDAVSRFKKHIAEQKTLEFKNIGALVLDASGSLVFEPNASVNYLTSSFGLSDFTLSAIERQAIDKAETRKEDPVPVVLHNSDERRRNWIGYAAAAVVVLGLSGFGGLKHHEKNVNAHNLMVQDEANKVVESKVQEATFVISNPLPNALLEIEKQTGNFHIVAGAFRIEANSDKKVKQLKALGYKARKIGVNRYGLHEVVYSSYSSRQEAQEALRTIRSNHNPDAWLLIKKID